MVYLVTGMVHFVFGKVYLVFGWAPETKNRDHIFIDLCFMRFPLLDE